ncbi:MAG: bifunctional riboflavin kinase/FAD synthetase [Christensenellaceae bacterium]|jgi:riboflavin kinase/FMN adenylyltransferase|nr:bifunctional riboflavin kinase/FAD synthetase [Christensenellaceae bacterium]
MGSIIALGTFDGVHLGHKKLIDTAVELAGQSGHTPLIYTFANHPLAALGQTPRLLMTDERRIEALRVCCDTVADVFDPAYAAIEPEAFARLLRTRFHIEAAVVGFNYTFGRRGAGDVALLRGLGAALGFAVREIPPMLYAGEPISSTRIRACVEQGDMPAARAMLGRSYCLEGEVLRGRALGRTMGFPTANILPPACLALPAAGVYATRARVGGQSFRAVTNIGKNPTVAGKTLTVETHLIGFDKEVYGQTLQLEFVQWLRGEVRFGSKQELAEQIAEDTKNADALLKNA